MSVQTTRLVLAILVSFCTVLPKLAAQTFGVVHTFSGGLDGSYPYAGLVIDGNGNLYGTTNSGGNLTASCPPSNAGCGEVFKLVHSPSGWTFRPLYLFLGGEDGQGPYGRVLIGPGALYGTTIEGGISNCPSGCGTVFQLVPPTTCSRKICPWNETVLYRFAGNSDGFYPAGDLTLDQAANLYGTTTQGGTIGPGTVYQLVHGSAGWTENVLYSMSGSLDGGNPYSGVIFDTAGNLYGTNTAGGLNNGGAVFELTPTASGWSETTLYDFVYGGKFGLTPFAGLLFTRAGNLIGANTSGGPNSSSAGTVYELRRSSSAWTPSLLYAFSGVGECGPMAALTIGPDGNLYGTTNGYPPSGDWGTVFKLVHTSSGWNETVLHRFTGGRDGGVPLSSVVFDSAGNLYGTTNLGGIGYGVVFEIKP